MRSAAPVSGPVAETSPSPSSTATPILSRRDSGSGGSVRRTPGGIRTCRSSSYPTRRCVGFLPSPAVARGSHRRRGAGCGADPGPHPALRPRDPPDPQSRSQRAFGEGRAVEAGESSDHRVVQAPGRVVACSSGNHGRAVAHMAALLGIDALISVPRWVDPVKLRAMREAGVPVRPAERHHQIDIRCSGADTLDLGQL